MKGPSWPSCSCRPSRDSPGSDRSAPTPACAPTTSSGSARGPAPTGGLTRVQRQQPLAAPLINETHYMSSCAVCGVRSEWDTKGLRTWLHKEDGKRDHIVES